MITIVRSVSLVVRSATSLRDNKMNNQVEKKPIKRTSVFDEEQGYRFTPGWEIRQRSVSNDGHKTCDCAKNNCSVEKTW